MDLSKGKSSILDDIIILFFPIHVSYIELFSSWASNAA